MRRYNQRLSNTNALTVLWVITSLFSSDLSAEEECLYDQMEQRKHYFELENQYPDSRYLEQENKIVISRENDEVHLRIGGCVHYGVRIQLRKTGMDKAWGQEELFQQVAGLLGIYGQGMVDASKFMQVLDQKRWADLSGENGDYYFLGYPGYTSFEVYQRIERDELVVGVSFYN